MAFSVDSALHRWKRLAGLGPLLDETESSPLLGCCKDDLIHTLDKQRVVHPNSLLRQKNWKTFSRFYRDNSIQTTRYSLITFLPKNILEQFYRFANLYFLFLAILNWMPQVEVFHKEITMIPLVIVMSIVAIKDAIEDLKKFQVDWKINHLKTAVYHK